jgi:hypothetical protein
MKKKQQKNSARKRTENGSGPITKIKMSNNKKKRSFFIRS